MTPVRHTVILVYSTSHALRAETILQGEGITCKLIPVPRHLSSNCGVCIRIQEADGERAMDMLTAAGVDTVGVYPI